MVGQSVREEPTRRNKNGDRVIECARSPGCDCRSSIETAIVERPCFLRAGPVRQPCSRAETRRRAGRHHYSAGPGSRSLNADAFSDVIRVGDNSFSDAKGLAC